MEINLHRPFQQTPNCAFIPLISAAGHAHILTFLEELCASGPLTMRRRHETVKATGFHVAPDGNDAWSGRSAEVNARQPDGPFATPQWARDAIRELKRSQGDTLRQPVTVLLRGGVYPPSAVIAGIVLD